MKYQIRLQANAKKELSNLSKKDKERIVKSFLALSYYPYTGIKLGEELKGYYSITIWPNKIIYRIFEKIKLVNITMIIYRQEIHRH